jgi:predicted NACHT family NTPase
VTPISHNDFFENVLRQGQSQYSQGKRIAIIGEPGAGKTTQLQKIGDWILQETDGIPIWIPLSAVGEKELKDYLTQDWLQTAISELEVTEASSKRFSTTVEGWKSLVAAGWGR